MYHTHRSNLTQFFLFFVSLSLLISCGGGGGGASKSSSSAQLLTQNAVPSFDRSTGYFVDPITVNIAAPAVDETLHYTDDGSAPSCNGGIAYTIAVNVAVSATTTIKAVICKDGYNNSSITTATYTLQAADVRVDPLSGSLTPIQDAIDAASVGDVVFIPAGTYTENNGMVTINKQITLIGQGSGTDDTSNTIVTDAIDGENPIRITVGGTSA